jgi:hypothetical protein
VAYFTVPFNYTSFLGGLEEITKILYMIDLLAKIRIRDFLHTNYKSQPLDSNVLSIISKAIPVRGREGP